MNAIEVSNVSKVFRVVKRESGLKGTIKTLLRPTYEKRVAVDNVSFSIKQQEIVGYIGVNGAGKSTTIKMLTGVLTPSSGEIEVLGLNPAEERVLNSRNVGVVFGQRSQLWWDLPLADSLNLVARIYRVKRQRYRELLEEFTAELNLGELLDIPIRNMSLGQKMRAEMVATLIHEPAIAYLDEPTIGLDIVVKEQIRNFIKRQNRERGTTVILTTHDLSDIEDLCQRVIIIDGGSKIFDGSIEVLKEKSGMYREIHFETKQLVESLNIPDGVKVIDKTASRVVLSFDRQKLSASEVAGIIMRQVEVLDFSINEPNLSSVVKDIYNKTFKVSTDK